MKKRLTALFLSVILLFSVCLTAAAETDPKPEDPTAETTQAQATTDIPAEEETIADVSDKGHEREDVPTGVKPSEAMAQTSADVPLKMNAVSLKPGVGETFTLTAGNKDASWSADSAAVSLSVNSRGNASVRAVSVGTAVVTASLGDRTVTCTITVKPMAKSVSLNETALTLGTGESYDLNSYVPASSAAYYRAYSTSNSAVVRLSKGGVITAVSAGRATITCKLSNGVKATCSVTVKPLAKSLSLNKAYIKIPYGGSFDLDSYVPAGYAAYWRRYTTADDKVAKLYGGGVVKGVGGGKTIVTCTLNNGVKAQCTVRVMSKTDTLNHNKGITVSYTTHNEYTGEDVWGENTTEAGVVDWMLANWPCCSYFDGEYSGGRCAEFGRLVRNSRAASQYTTNFSDLKMTPDNLRRIAKGCKPTTTLSFGPKGIAYHMIVLLRVTQNRIWWVDCNWNWDNRVHYREATLDDFVDFVHWRSDKAGYIASISRVDALEPFTKPVTNAAYARSSGKARIVWTHVDGAKSYQVFLMSDKGNKLVSTQTSLSYTNEASKLGTKYTYLVRAVMKNNTRRYGNQVSVYGRLDAPKTSLDRVNKCIRWKAVEGAQSYRIDRRIGETGDFKTLTTVKATSYKEAAMVFKTEPADGISYRVTAISGKSSAANSVAGNVVVVTDLYCIP